MTCGHQVHRSRLEDEDYSRQTLRGRGGHIDAWAPDEHEQVCPDCGTRDSFEPMVLCGTCDQAPCRCGDEAVA